MPAATPSSSAGSPGRGTLRVHLGAARGVGTTYAMLDEGRRRRARGTDVVVAAVDTRDRPSITGLLDGLEVLGTSALDVPAVLRRNPVVALVDDLARVDQGAGARWKAVDELLDAGIDVVGTLEISAVTSLSDVAERITGLHTSDTVPDSWMRAGDQVELVDMTPEALRRRVAHGNVFPSDEVDAARSAALRVEVLAAMRQLALLWVAERIEDQLHGSSSEHLASSSEVRERVLVALTGAPGNDRIVRRAARLASRSHAELVGVHVSPTAPALGAERDLEQHRRLLEELGGTFRDEVGDDVAETLVAVARAERATQLVVGASRRSRLREMTGGSVLNRLLRLARDIDVHVISAESTEPRAVPSLRRRGTPLPARRRLFAWTLVVVGLPLLVVLLAVDRDELGLTTMLLLIMGFVVGVSAIGGLAPALVAAVAGAMVVNYHVVTPTGTLKIDALENAVSLGLFVAVGATVASLVDRVARQSYDSVRARTEAAALARAAATQAGERDPLPELAEQARTTFGLESLSVLQRQGDGTWSTLAASGDPAPASPTEGTSRPLGDDGRTVVVFAHAPTGHDPALVEAFLDQLTVAVSRRELQEAASTAAALAQADALRTGILQAVSHDLRTPLAGIKASVTSLLSPEVQFGAGDTRLFLGTIDEEVDRLDRVVGNLLDMGRLQTGTIRVMNRHTALEEVVSAAMANLAAPRHSVRIEVPETLPLLFLDGALLERALANVVANALAQQPSDEPVRIEAAALGAGNRAQIVLRVIDRGPGIPPQRRSAAFEPFQRLGDRSSQAGVGLGLAIARGFTEAVGGELVLDDTPGGGLTVTFCLPVVTDGGSGVGDEDLRP